MKCHHHLLFKALLRRGTTWVTSFLKKNLKSSWHDVMMLLHKRLPKKLLRRLRSRPTILGRLLSKMGWKEGEGLGSEKRGRADPIVARDVKKDHLGVGAVKPGEVAADDDIYERYKKRMMLGYRYRPNPLNNPRKQYY